MEVTAGEVLFETRRHATRSFSSNSFQLQTEVRGGYFSFLTGLNQAIEKWKGHRWVNGSGKPLSLFVSERGEYVAVAAGNEIVFLQKDDNYMFPCGVFTSKDKLTKFVHGTWSESHGVLGIVDNSDILYFIRQNGEEVSRMTRKQVKLSASIIGLARLERPLRESSSVCTFQIIMLDGLVRCIETDTGPCGGMSCEPTLEHRLVHANSPQNISCIDLHPELSLVALVGDDSGVSQNSKHQSGSCCFSLWRITGSVEPEFLCSTYFQGYLSTRKSYSEHCSTPKVLLSSQGNHAAALDSAGNIFIFNLNAESWAISDVNFSDKCYSHTGDNLQIGNRTCLHDITDFTWWSDHIVILARKSGHVIMLDVLHGTKLLKSDTVFIRPILERAQQRKGYVFILENITSPDVAEAAGIRYMTLGQDLYNLQDVRKLNWRLFSLVERSASEMYTILISNKQYEAALDFANRQKLDVDEVFKSQWLHSDQGTTDIRLYLSKIKDLNFVLSACVNKVGPSEDAVKASISYGLQVTDKYRSSHPENFEFHQVQDFWRARLQLLQCKDRLETFMGINMGRFSVSEYSKFRIALLHETATSLAENGKIGALNLLVKRHPYSLSSSILNILSAIPETVPVQSYSQLLPGTSPPGTISLREPDWVESEKMIDFINELCEEENAVQVRTEPILKLSLGYVWPSIAELLNWYQTRARDIDRLSGQLDNCLLIIEFAIQKGIIELQLFQHDIICLSQLIYSDIFYQDMDLQMNLVTWEQLTDYEKFKTMLKGVKEDTVVGRLRELAIPFIQNRSRLGSSKQVDSCLVRWLVDISVQNQLELCLIVIEEGFKDFQASGFFKDEVEAVETALHCIYSCTLTDRWSTMASILSKLVLRGFDEQDLFNMRRTRSAIEDSTGYAVPLSMSKSFESLERRVKLAEGHVEAGRLLAFYHVPRSITFFLEANLDEKGVKQLLRLILSKFGRRQPARSDNEWANMWRDLQLLQEKAFPFLDLEFVLLEFCRGLLKAGKFSLARNYLRGTNSITLAADKAENLVIQAAREYFFSASSLACAEIWNARECLNLFPNSKNVKAENDMMDALTVRLPSLGVTLLPLQFRQIRNPMEIINMVIRSQSVAYLDVDELIEIAKLLGLSSQDDMAAVQEVVAREAALTGDLQLSFDLCLILAKKGHGPIWDLCAAIARGPALDNMDTTSRKKLLGFALSNCDEESLADLLQAWKDLDDSAHYENLMALTGSHPNHSEVPVTQRAAIDQEVKFRSIEKFLACVVKDPSDTGTSWNDLLGSNEKLLKFGAVELPWLIELSQKSEYGKKSVLVPGTNVNAYISVRTQAAVCILSWLARHEIAPSDGLIASLAKSIMDPPVSEEDDRIGCAYLLNLRDAFHGVEVVEEQLRSRKSYQEVCGLMNVGMTYSALNNCCLEDLNPLERRHLLLHKFQEKHASFNSEEVDKIDKVQQTFWKEWKLKLEEKKKLADQARALEQLMPGVETARFLSGDFKYIESAIFSIIDSIKAGKRHVLKGALKLANTYGLDCSQVLLRFLGSALVSENWTNEDIDAEISEYKGELLKYSTAVIDMITSTVYPSIDGCQKLRLSYLYGILSECHQWLEKNDKSAVRKPQDQAHCLDVEFSIFYRTLEQECRKISFIRTLNFKNVANLNGLNFEHFSQELLHNINESSVEAVAEMVERLAGIYKGSLPEDFLSRQSVFKHYVQSALTNFAADNRKEINSANPEDFNDFIHELQQHYSCCCAYIRGLRVEDVLDVMGIYYQLSLSLVESPPQEPSWLDPLVMLLNVWIRLADDIHDIVSGRKSLEKEVIFDTAALQKCLEVFRELLLSCKVQVNEGWTTAHHYVRNIMRSQPALDISGFCQSMIVSGTSFAAVAEVFSQASRVGLIETNITDAAQNLSFLYVGMLESFLLNCGNGYAGSLALHNLLSSLSKLVGSREDLEKVRHAVWIKLLEFSDDMQLQSDMRVHALELMQCISGKNLIGLPDELSDIVPWEGWDVSCITMNTEREEQGRNRHPDTSNRFTNTLVALKSTQLVAAISPTLEITSDDLISVDSAVSCFTKLASFASSELHYETLEAILEEWEVVFSGNKVDVIESPKDENDWASEDWDEGWESFPEDLSGKERKDGSASVHPLHVCWMVIVSKLLEQSSFKNVMKLIDRSLPKPKGTLLTEDEARALSQLVDPKNCFMALKIMLLFPYETLWFECLDAVELRLESKGSLDASMVDQEFLALIFSSRVFPTICTNFAYRSTFTFLCYSMGNLSRRYQEQQLSLLKSRADGNRNEGIELVLFSRILFPHFVAELVLAKEFLLVGRILSQFIHIHASCSVINTTEAILRRYLEGQITCLKEGFEMCLEEKRSQHLVNTISGLSTRLNDLLLCALTALSSK